MRKHRIYFVDGNYIDVQVEEKLEIGAQTALARGYFFQLSQVRAVVAHENLCHKPAEEAAETKVIFN
jgi:hypothetical protein